MSAALLYSTFLFRSYLLLLSPRRRANRVGDICKSGLGVISAESVRMSVRIVKGLNSVSPPEGVVQTRAKVFYTPFNFETSNSYSNIPQLLVAVSHCKCAFYGTFAPASRNVQLAVF